MDSTSCTRCGTLSEGAFCPSCGSALRGPPCPHCGAAPPPDARFCTSCGRRLGRSRPPVALYWLLAGLVVGSVAAVLFLGEGPGASSTPGAGGGPDAPGARGPSGMSGPNDPGGMSGAPGVPLSGDMRENADALFNRVMEEVAAGDSARAVFFVPMALRAYEMAGELDTDALYHVSVLQTIGGDPVAGRATAERILAGQPRHLLALGAAAQAAHAQGESADARAYWRRFVEAYPEERKRELPEYRVHSGVLPDYGGQAEAFLAD